MPLDAYLDQYLNTPEQRRTATASSFASSLELARQGQIELRQTLTFGPLLMRRRRTDGPQGEDSKTMIDEPFGDGPAEVAERNLRVLEALLFASTEPLAPEDIAPYLGEGADVPLLLERLVERYRGPRRQSRAPRRQAGPSAPPTTWRSCCAARKPRAASCRRAALEVLAIIAYHQPATRAEVEEVRGVAERRRHLRYPDADRLDPDARPPPHAGPPGDLWHHRRLPRPFRARKPRRTCPGSRN